MAGFFWPRKCAQPPQATFDFWAIGFQDILSHDGHFWVQSILSTQHKVAEMSLVNGRETLSPKRCIVVTQTRPLPSSIHLLRVTAGSLGAQKSSWLHFDAEISRTSMYSIYKFWMLHFCYLRCLEGALLPGLSHFFLTFLSLPKMLTHLGRCNVEFLGRPHSIAGPWR